MCILLHDIILIYILYNSEIDVVSYWEGTHYIFFSTYLFKVFFEKYPLLVTENWGMVLLFY